MKYFSSLILVIFGLNGYAQSNGDIEISLVPKVDNRIYVNERIEFKTTLKNTSEEITYYIPARNFTEYPTAFVDDDFDMFGPDGEEIMIRSFPGGGTAAGVSHPSRPISAKGGKVGSRSFYYTFTVPGTYKLIYTVKMDAARKPAKLTTDYKSFEAKGELTFEVMERGGISFQKKDIDYETFKKQKQINDLAKANDSTNVFNLSVSNVNEASLKNIARFGNLKGLSIYAENLESIPAEIFELDLYELSLTVKQTNSIDLSGLTKFKNLRSLKLHVESDATLPSDFSVFTQLKTLSLSGFKNPVRITALPTETLSTLYFANLIKLEGVSGDFSAFKKLGKLKFKQIEEFEMPQSFLGKMWELELNPGSYSSLPDISALTLSRIRIESYTGETLPDSFSSGLKEGCQIMFPRALYKSKPYKQMRKMGFQVFPKQ